MATSNTKSDATQSLFVVVNDSNTGKVKRIAVPSDIQIGLQGNPAELQLLGRLSVSTNDIHIASSITNLSSNNTIANVYATTAMSGSSINLMLPSNPRDGELHIIKDASGTAANSPLIVTSADASLIDGNAAVTMTTAYGSLLVYWASSAWRQFGSGASSGGASTTSAYALISSDPTLLNSRTLTAGTNVSFSDGGPGSTFTINASAGSGGGADSQAAYVLEAATSSLPNSRTLTAGTRIVITDGGPGSTLTLASSLSGSNFNGWIDGGNKMRTTGSISIASDGGFAANYGTDNFFYVSGTVGLAQGNASRQASVFAGDTLFSGSIVASGSGVSFPQVSSFPSPQPATGSVNVFASSTSPAMRPFVNMQWNSGYATASLQPFIGTMRQNYWRASQISSVSQGTYGTSVTAAGTTQFGIPSAGNSTGSYGQTVRANFGTTTATQNNGLAISGLVNGVWLGTDRFTGGFYFMCQFSMDSLLSDGSHDSTGSMFCGFADGLGASSFGGSQPKNWEQDTSGGKFGVGWTARLAGNNVVNRNPGMTGSYNWKAISGPNAKGPQIQDTGIQIIVQHIMQVEVYMPAGISSSVYWSLKDLTAATGSNGTFLSSNNALPSPLNGAGQNYLYPGCFGGPLTGTYISPGFQLAMISQYFDAPY